LKQIPQYKLDDHYRPVHRIDETATAFGYNQLNPLLRIKDFELYSSDGLTASMGPLRSEFYRIGLTLRGSCDVQLGLEHYQHRAGTVNCTFPNQLFSKSNISKDVFGYYLLFNPCFLDTLIPESRMADEFPFFSYSGVPFFQLEPLVVQQIEGFVLKINEELQMDKREKGKAIQLYLYLILLEIKRSYVQKGLGLYTDIPETTILMIKFRKLVHQYYLEKQQVADYAELLHVTPNHLNRTIKEISGRTASDHIAEMLLQEAKALLKYTDLSVAEIAYRLQFSEPSSFSRFFKKEADLTPVGYRENA
jgi:AraC family transcriptional regulator, transcriptional activator of pobA